MALRRGAPRSVRPRGVLAAARTRARLTPAPGRPPGPEPVRPGRGARAGGAPPSAPTGSPRKPGAPGDATGLRAADRRGRGAAEPLRRAPAPLQPDQVARAAARPG